MAKKDYARLNGWVRQEAGWWTKDGVGGVCKESDSRWYFYPHDGGFTVMIAVDENDKFNSMERAMVRIGPFISLRQAIGHANQALPTLR